MYVIPDEPFGLSDVRKRHAFLKRKHVFGFVEDEDEDDSDALRVSVPSLKVTWFVRPRPRLLITSPPPPATRL